MILFVFIALLAVQDQPKPLPDIKPFLAEVRRTLHTDDNLLSQYTYTEKRTLIQLDSNQNPRSTEVDVFEVFPGSAERRYRRQIVRSGKPLSAADLEKGDQKLQKRISSAQRKSNDQAAAQREKKEARILDDVFAGYDVEVIGRENLSGHPAVLVKFTPRPAYTPNTKEGIVMRHVAGRAWISEEDHQVARVEMEVVDPISIGLGLLAKLQKGASITAERQKFNDEIWLPVKMEITLNARVLLLKGFNIRQLVEYSDHKKYSVDTILKFSGQEAPAQP